MRKLIAIVMSLLMLSSVIVCAVPVSASQETSSATAENIDYIDALYFEKAPTVDGIVTEEEWGSSSFTVSADDAATKDDTEPYNRFVYWRTGDINDYYTWSYTVWMRWDENYFYIAVKVNDPDGHSLKNGTSETWNGDAIQMRVDVQGPNAIVGGEEFYVTETYSLPWSSKSVPDFLFGYVEIAGGFTEAWENITNKGMTSFSKNPMGTAKVVVAPAGSNYSSETQSGITTYEVGIPWAYMLNGENDAEGNQITALTYTTYSAGRKGNLSGGIGRELGISMVNLDDGTNPDAQWDAYLAWGSGICTAHQTDGARSATGSNSVVLSDAKVTQSAGYKTSDPTSLLDATFSQENIDKKGVFYDYLAGDLYKEKPIKYDQLSVVTYDSDPDGDLLGWGASLQNYIPREKLITNIGGEHGNVLDWTYNRGDKYGEPAVNYVDSTYDDIKFFYPVSYTFEMEFKYTDTVLFAENYASNLYNFFGGANMVSFQCGYNFSNREFQITDTATGNMDHMTGYIPIAKKSYDLKKDTWYRWRFQFDNESCTARLWLDDLTTTADDGDGWGEMIFNTCWRYFYVSGRDEVLICWRQMNVQAMYDNVKIYNFGSISDVEIVGETDASQVQGNGSGTTTTTVTGGGQITIDESKVYKKDNQWHVPVPVRSEYLNATQLTFSFEYDATKAKFAGISGLAEGTYTVTETEAGKVGIVIKSFDEIKKMKAGDTCFEIVLDATDANATVKDLKLALTDSYVYTVTTGDTMTFVIIGCIAAITIVTSVVVIRRRKENE